MEEMDVEELMGVMRKLSCLWEVSSKFFFKDYDIQFINECGLLLGSKCTNNASSN